jgi:iron complex transport system substrate-binding protein
MRMNSKKKFGIFGGLLLALVLVVAATLPSPSLATTYPLTLTDDLGREVTIEAAPERIISLAPSNTEILFALGLGDRVVAVTDYCDYPSEALEKEKIGGPWSPSIENIVALEPDLVLAAGVNPANVITSLEDLGLTVFGIESTDLDDILDDINTVGRITDRERAAGSLINQMQRKIDTVTDKTEELSSWEKPSVFHILWHDPIYTSGQGTFIHDLIEKGGGTNIFDDLEGYNAITLETLIARDPEVIIVTAMGGEGSGTWDWVNTETRLADVSARQNGRIYFLESNWLERPGPRITYGLVQLTKRIHPGIFDDSERLYYITGDIFGKESLFRISPDGEIERKIEATSEDGRLTMTIPEGTIAEDEDGEPLESLEITTDENPPPPPEGAHIIDLAYNFGPSGAEFDPSITIEFIYDPNAIPAGVDEEDLTLAYYDEGDNEWVELPSTVDPAIYTITASVNHFTTFAIIGSEEEGEGATPEPATFSLSSLAISPTEVNVGEDVTITVMISNTGGELGNYEATLKINGEVEITKEVDIAAGDNQQVSFTTSKNIGGTYIADIGGLTDSFVVVGISSATTPPPAPTSPPAKPVNWWLIAGIAGGAIGVAVPLTIRRRQRA